MLWVPFSLLFLVLPTIAPVATAITPGPGANAHSWHHEACAFNCGFVEGEREARCNTMRASCRTRLAQLDCVELNIW